MPVRTSIDEISEGDEFRVAKGSRAGSIGVSGSVDVVELTENSTQLKVSVGKFGLNMDIQLDAVRSGDVVDITASGSRFDALSFQATVVEETATTIRLSDVAGELADTLLELDGEGSAKLDAEIPSIGAIAFVIGA